MSTTSNVDMEQLWQLKTFPFDPSRRLSSSIVLARSKEGKFYLFSVTKGAPDQISDLCFMPDSSGDEKQSFRNQMQDLERQGYRTIGIAFRDLSKCDVASHLFPRGLDGEPATVAEARVAAKSLHRHDFEDGVAATRGSGQWNVSGFACFETSIRPSSKRVLRELKLAGIKNIMCTGDGMLAAVAVSLKVGLVSTSRIAVFDRVRDEKGDSLILKVIKARSLRDGSLKISLEGSDKPVSTKLVRKVLAQCREGKLSIAAMGPAMDLILSNSNKCITDEAKRLLLEAIPSFSIIARASPTLKKALITSLKNCSNCEVAMCGKFCPFAAAKMPGST